MKPGDCRHSRIAWQAHRWLNRHARVTSTVPRWLQSKLVALSLSVELDGGLTGMGGNRQEGSKVLPYRGATEEYKNESRNMIRRQDERRDAHGQD
jgi:hypothetical protein